MTSALGNLAGWEAALDALENQLDAAARAMGAGGFSGEAGSGSTMAVSAGSTSDSWVAPRNLGPIPAELGDRVQDLLHNQQKLIGELEQARGLTLKHLVAVRSVPPERDARASVYLDVKG